MGKLLAAIEAQLTPKGPRCTVGLLLGELSPQDAADLRAAMAMEKVYSSTIARILRDNDFGIASAASITRHRRGDCQCPKTAA